MIYKNIPAAKTRSTRAANPQSRTRADERAESSPKLRAAGGKRRIPRAAKTREIRDSVVFPRTRLRVGAIYLRIKAQIGPPAFPCQPRCAAFPLPSALWRRSRLRRLAEPAEASAISRLFPFPARAKKIRGIPRIIKNYMVVGTGFEPVNGKAERIYSPRPLAPWIPYHRVN